MEFADGGNLQERIAQKLSETEILNILFQLLEGLKYLHSQKKIFHGDLRPANILFVNGQLKIADFKMAKRIEKTMESQVTFKGTLNFMSPEMFIKKQGGMPSDIWSTGVIIYYLSAKKLPFISEDFDTFRDLILSSEPPPLPTEFTNKFRKLILSMFNKSPVLRPTAENLLKSMHQDFPQSSSVFISENNILDIFSQLQFYDFIKLCHFEANSHYLEGNFRLFSHSFRNNILLKTNKFYHIFFHQNIISLKSYSIQSPKTRNEVASLSWSIEVFDKNQKWILVDKHEKMNEIKEKGKIMTFHFQQEISCSAFRIIFPSNVYKSRFFIGSFELFGTISDESKTLQNLLSIPKEITIIPPIIFSFSETGHNGLFKFFSLCSIKNRNNVFTIGCSYSKKNSSVQNLLFWNEHDWEAKSSFPVFFIAFTFPWVFKIFGYRLRSGNQPYLKNWTVEGVKSNHDTGDWKRIDLDQQRNNTTLSSKYVEKCFPIQNEEFFDFIRFNFSNSVDKKHFCLNAIEIFGILKKVE
jgi:serine/threonine protein kinase